MNSERAKRKLAAILSADVKGYSRLMEEDEQGTVERLKECRALFFELMQAYQGRVVDCPGDNILAEFISVIDAVEAALSIQRTLHERNLVLPAESRMEFRIGINLGDVIEDGEKIYGDGVNIAARVESLAKAGGICVSGAAFAQIEGKLSVTFDDLGKHHVKNISRPIQIYAIREAPSGVIHRPRPTHRRFTWRMAAVAIVIMLVAAGLWMGIPRKRADLPSETPSLAVLPFVDMSLEKDQEYFADGLAEELLNTLSRVPGLRVVGRTSSFQFKGKNEDLRIIGQKLNASKILEGSVRRESGRVRVTAQLINASDGFHLWSETYSYEMKDIFAIQDQIARSVTEALKWTLIGEAAPSQQTANGDAYNAYLLGQYYSGRRSIEDLRNGIDYLNRAVRLDPDYAAAWVALAVAHVRQADWGYIPPDEGYREANAAAQRALKLNPDLAMAHSALGWIRMNHEWDWEGARRSFRRSLELEPANAKVLGNAAALFVVLGQLEEGISMMRRVVQRDPLNLSAHLSLGTYAYYAGHLEEAAVALGKALELNPDGGGIHIALGLIRLAEMRPQEALDAIDQETDPGWRLFGHALAYQALGREQDSKASLAELIAGHQSDSAYQISEVYSYWGDPDQAFKWLERAYAQRDGGLPLINVDPLMRSMKDDPRYRPLIGKLGLNPRG